MSNFKFNSNRLKSNLRELAKIGTIEGKHGINRVSFTTEDMAGRKFLQSYMGNIGLETKIDGVGNVWGRWSIENSKQEISPAVIIGSHLDTVPEGGEYDGALGVLVGLEIVQSLKEQGFKPKNLIEVLATSDEEGSFGGMLGSQSLAAVIDQEWLETAQNQNGTTLKEAMHSCGFDYKNALTNCRSSETVKAFLELHIEQGPVLDNKKISVGIVNAISGCAVWKISFVGLANHSGTTPMDMRSDAYIGAAKFACAIQKIISDVGSNESRLTVGQIELSPNFPHTIPGQAVFSLVIRDIDLNVMQILANQCRSILKEIANSHSLKLSIDEVSWLDPAPCDPNIIKILQKEAQLANIEYITMSSGGGHDCQFMSFIAPSGLIFVPSKDGISHSSEEFTEWKDIEVGCQLLLNSVVRLSS